MSLNLEFESEPISVECTESTKEFLNIERSCNNYKGSDEEIKTIFSEIEKLTDRKLIDKSDENDDVELILKRAEDIAAETQTLLKYNKDIVHTIENKPSMKNTKVIPMIKVTSVSAESSPAKMAVVVKKKQLPSTAISDNKKKIKTRPLSANNVDLKRKEPIKTKSANNSPKKALKNDIDEELKDTIERVKAVELLNVKLTSDNKALKNKLTEVSEQHHVSELKLIECEKFIQKIGKEYEKRTTELNSVKENESRILEELAKERDEKKSLKAQKDKDIIVIQDLQRQCREMELILKRKHPDSVSALIVASKSTSVDDNKKKLLEERITRLEQELKDKEDHFQNILVTLQEKFSDMKEKYESHIIDVERQLMDERKLINDLKSKINKSNLVDVCIQTNNNNIYHHATTQTFIKPDRASSAVSRLSQNSALILNKLKEDSYLVATIKGLQAELTAKQRTIAKINRETDELKKNLKTLQREKEVLNTLHPQKRLARPSKSAENIRVNIEMESELNTLKEMKDTLAREKSCLLESLKRTNEDLIILKKKRIQDLHTLQLAHEKELMQMNMQIYPLQEEIKLLNRTVEILQDRVRSADDKLMRYQAGYKDFHAGGDNNSSKDLRLRK